jgi:hypothetical protein
MHQRGFRKKHGLDPEAEPGFAVGMRANPTCAESTLWSR